MSAKHIEHPLQCPPVSGNNRHARVWSHIPGYGAVIVADFGVSRSIDEMTKIANARRAAACWNLCLDLSAEEIEAALKPEAGLVARIGLYRRAFT